MNPACDNQALHVVTHLDYGGVESHMATIGAHLRDRRWRHDFCAIGHGGRTAKRLLAGGARVFCLETPARIPSPRALWRLYHLLRRLRPQVVHAHGAEANFHGLLAAVLARVPVRVGEEIGLPEHSPSARVAFAMAYRGAQRVIGVSSMVTRCLVETGEVRAQRAVTLHNPVSLACGAAVPAPPADTFRLCFVGRLEPVKNLEALLDGFAALAAEGRQCELWLIGDGSLRHALERAGHARGLGHAISFLGYQNMPMEWVRQCHACVLPSLSEGFGLAMVEAMGCGVPVVCSRVGAAPELIVDGVNGWLIDGFDAGAIGAALTRAWCARTRISGVGARARETVRPLFDPEAYLDRLERLYAECLEERLR